MRNPNKATTRVSINRPDTYERLPRTCQKITCEQQPVHTYGPKVNLAYTNLVETDLDHQDLLDALNSSPVFLSSLTVEKSFDYLSFLQSRLDLLEKPSSTSVEYKNYISQIMSEISNDPKIGVLKWEDRFSSTYSYNVAKEWSSWKETRGYTSKKFKQ